MLVEKSLMRTTVLKACAVEIVIREMQIKIVPVKAECSFLRLA